MSASKRSLLLAVVLSILGALSVQAGVIQIPTGFDRSPNVKIDPFPEPEGTLLPTPYVLTASDGVVITYSLLPGGVFLRGDLSGTTFLYNGAVITGIPSPVDIEFGTPMIEYSTLLLSNAPRSTTFEFTAFNGATELGTFSVSGNLGTPLFAGVRATGDDVITRLAISSDTNDFLFCNCGRVAVPEPATAIMLGIGLGAGLIGWVGRRIRRGASFRSD